MNLEKLNKILPYCGYGVKVMFHEKACDVLAIDTIKGKFCLSFEGNKIVSDGGHDEMCPILFPPDCLTKEIETEHGKEIPLIEIAKIVCYSYTNKHWEIQSRSYQIENGTECTETYARNEDIEVGINASGDVMISRETDKEFLPVIVMHQYEYFQYLYSRHIAFNLDPGEYVNVESLEVNPYK